MSSYICHSCEVQIRVQNQAGRDSVFAEVCPVCQKPDDLEYL
jgi:formamidopyrimidine-DNA glycosylase